MSVPDSTIKREDIVILVEAVIKAKSDKALLIEHDEIPTANCCDWFPLSQIDDDSELFGKCKVGEVGDLVITKWIAEQKGII